MNPKRQLGFLSALLLVVANMIGSGVFTTSGFLLAQLYTPGRVMAVWLAGGVTAMLGALCYGALARQFPESGGEYLFLARTWRPALGCLAGWISLLVGFSAPTAAMALAFGEYTRHWVPSLQAAEIGTLLLGACGIVHSLHVQRGAWVQNIAVLIKLLLIMVLFGWAGTCLRPPPMPASGHPSWGSYAVSLVWVSFSYSGWNAVVYIASEIRNPERALPWAMGLGAGVVSVLYLGLNTVFLLAAPAEELAGKLDIGRTAALALGGPPFGEFVAVLISVALATSVSSMIMAGPRVYARMADDGYLPGWFGFPANGPPRHSILLQLALALVMLWSATFEALLTYIGFSLGLCTAATVLGLIGLRLRAGASIRVVGWPVVPAVFVVTVAISSALTTARKPVESGLGLLSLIIGWLACNRASGKQQSQGLS